MALLRVTTITIDGITAMSITDTTDPPFPTMAIARIRRRSINARTLEHRFRCTHIAGGGSRGRAPPLYASTRSAEGIEVLATLGANLALASHLGPLLRLCMMTIARLL
jgi:hypothetical protein